MNHLLIGLGGTGGRVIRSFRKIVYQSFRSAEPQGVNVDFLYVDSDDRMMGLTDSSWKIFGQSVQLDPKNQLIIKSADLVNCLNDLQSYGNLKSWVGTRDQWKDILSGIADATIGGQKRRLGRFLFARGIDEFERKLNDIVRGLRTRGGNDKSVAFHIVTGLAGGTGSGSVIDAITQIRRTYPFDTGHTHPIIVYALLPDRVPKEGWNTGNYWANGYAALMELNALGLEWQPTDLKSPLGGKVARQRQFDGCYVFSNENEYVSVDVEEEMPDIVASFLYQKTVMVQDSTFHQRLGRIEACENGDSSPEYDTESKSDAPRRSRNFLTFGVKRLAYPEEEIQEYISYTFGLQAANQLQFNNWVDSLGYADRELPQAQLAEARKKELLERWKLSDDHLLLSRGILASDASDKSWKLLHNEWHDLIPAYRRGATEGVDQHWLLAAKGLFDRRFQSGFRRLGVGQFYATRLSAKGQHSYEITSQIERQLFDEWTAGDRSMHDTCSLVDALLGEIEVRKKAFEKRSSDLAAELDELNGRIAANEAQWAEIGIVGQYVLKHRDRLLDAQCPLLANFYERQTLREAYAFASALLKQLLQDVSELKAHLVRITSRINQVTGQYRNEIAARLKDRSSEDNRSARRSPNDQVVRFYDRSLVTKTTETMRLDGGLQKTNASEVRKTLVAQLGGTHTFAQVDEVLTTGTLRDVIDRTCAAFSKSAHDMIARSEQQRILGVNIVNKLRERYDADDEGLRVFVQEIMAHANDYLVIDRNQQYPSDIKPVRETIIILPPSDNSAFAQRLTTVFTNFAPGAVHVATSETRRNEVVVVSLLNLFPLRYAALTNYLRNKFEERLASTDPVRVRHEVFTEGDGGQLPNLFRLTAVEAGGKALPFYLLGHALGLIQQSPNGRGAREWALLYKDADGLPADPIYFGAALSDAAVRLEDTAVLLTLQREVTARLGSKEHLNDEGRRQIQSALGEVVSRVQAERQDDLNDGVFRTYRDAARTAIKMVSQGV